MLANPSESKHGGALFSTQGAHDQWRQEAHDCSCGAFAYAKKPASTILPTGPTNKSCIVPSFSLERL